MKSLLLCIPSLPILTLASTLILTLGTPADVIAGSMRCGKWVVSEDATPAELLEKCGTPQEQKKSTEDIWARNTAGYNRKVGIKTTERWFYKPGPGALRMAVTIVDGRITHIERAP